MAQRQAQTDMTWTNVRSLRWTHYGLLLLIYGFYGYQVCPFLELLTLQQLLTPAAIALAGQIIVSEFILQKFTHASLDGAPSRLFWSDLLACFAGGIFVAFYNYFVYGFPLESGAKATLAFSAIGFYIALDLTFEREMRLSKQLRAAGQGFPIASQFLPFRTKLVFFSMVNILVVSSIAVLVIFKDLIWVNETTIDPWLAQRIIIGELIFVIGILAAYIFRVIQQYSRKTDFNLREESDALLAVQSGDLSSRVAVTSNDEFGRIALLTNDTIEKLEDALSEVEQTRDVTINALVSLAAKRDKETGMHLRRTQLYARALARELAKLPKYARTVTPDFIELIHNSAPLHDVGKVGIPDAILTKPGKLDGREFEIMKTHAAIGAAALEDADTSLGGNSFLSMARDIAQSHHEKWDGSGYPQGLAGPAIPLSGRIMAIADVYDALRSKRVYKPAMPHQQAASIVLEGRGSHFDPELVDAFERIQQQFVEIADAYQDKNPALEASAA